LARANLRFSEHVGQMDVSDKKDFLQDAVRFR
jgi:hypothetical protein